MVKTGITLNPSMIMKVIFSGMINAVGLVSENHTCLTWDIIGSTLTLQCRTGNFDDPVSFVDPAGIIQAKCSFNQECKSLHRNGKITGEYAQNKVIFSIDNIIPQYLNGNWTCVQGSIESTTNVSTTKGIIASKNVYLVGKFIDTNKIKLTCSSCREPEGNYAEFYINGNSFTSVSYSNDNMNETGKCQQGAQECSSETCSCSASGNVFTLVLQINKDKKEYSYGCEMRFTDPIQQYKFLQVATLYVNGANLFSNGTVTRITKSAEKKFIPPTYNKTLTKLNTTESSFQTTTTVITRTVKDSEADTKGQEMLILVGVLSAMLVGVFLAFTFRKLRLKIKRDSSKRKSKQLAEKKHDTTVKDFDLQSIEETEALIAHNLVEKKYLLKTQISDKNSCQPCSVREKNVEALHWCMECGESLCSECQNFHNAVKVCRNHKIVPIGKVPSNYNMSTDISCSEHPYSKYDYLCQDHDTLCCKECIPSVHGNCTRVQALVSLDAKTRVNVLLEECWIEIDKLIADQKTARDAYVKVIGVIGEDVKNIKKSLSRLSDEICQDEDSVVKQREYIVLLHTQLELAKDMCISKTKKIITTLDDSVELVNKQIFDLKFVNANGSEDLLFLYIYSTTKPLLVDKKRQIQKIISDPSPSRLQYQSSVGAIGSIGIMNDRVLDSSLKPIKPSPFQVPIKPESISTDLKPIENNEFSTKAILCD